MNEVLLFILSILIGALGYFLANWHFAPVLAYRELLARIVSITVFRINVIANSPYGKDGYSNPEIRETSLDLRQLACDIRGINNILDRPSLIRKLFGVPRFKELEKAASCFIYLSNTLNSRSDQLAVVHSLAEKYSRISEIEKALKIFITEDAKGIAENHRETEEVIRRKRER